MWAGVDVGGESKGFDVAVISSQKELIELQQVRSSGEVVQLVSRFGRPNVVGIDGPESPAEDGAALRNCELKVRHGVCGIRWTPDAARIEANPGYYGWIRNGFRVWRALRAEGITAVEVFPTASWTIWLGPRRGRSRASWSREGLCTLGITCLPTRSNQDQRDAIAAAWTARSADRMEVALGYDPIVIPK